MQYTDPRRSVIYEPELSVIRYYTQRALVIYYSVEPRAWERESRASIYVFMKLSRVDPGGIIIVLKFATSRFSWFPRSRCRHEEALREKFTVRAAHRITRYGV
jgi:hypothetical protein